MSKFCRSLIKKITLFTLLAALGLTSLSSCNTFRNKQQMQKNKAIVQIQETEKQIKEDYQVKQKILSKKFESVGNLIIATGEIELSYNFTNRNKLDMSKDISNKLTVIHDYLTHRDFKYTGTYKYNYTYDLSKIKTEIKDECLHIYINDCNLKLNDVYEMKEKSIIDYDVGILARNFNATEMQVISQHVEANAKDTLNGDKDLKQQALNSLEKAIKDLAYNLNIKTYEVHTDKVMTIKTTPSNCTMERANQYSSIELK